MFIWTLLLSLGQAGTISDAMHLGDCHSVLTATAVIAVSELRGDGSRGAANAVAVTTFFTMG